MHSDKDSQRKEFVVYADGSSRGNPGPAGIGVAIFEGVDSKKPIEEISKYIGITTNNSAEYEAVIYALNWLAAKVGPGQNTPAIIKLDSELIYNQIIGSYRVKTPHIRMLLKRVQCLVSRIVNLSFILVPRKENRLANRLAQQASRVLKQPRKEFKQEKLIK